MITSSADEDARVIFGANIDDGMNEEVRITVVATGFDSRERRTKSPGVVEVQAQGTWSAPQQNVLRMREEEAVPQRSKVNFQASMPERPVLPKVEMPKPRPLPPPPVQTKEEDEIEIPAFIRKKMM